MQVELEGKNPKQLHCTAWVCKWNNKEQLSRVTELIQEFGIALAFFLPKGSLVNMCD